MRVSSGFADVLLGGEAPARVLALGKAGRALARGAADRWPGVQGFILETALGAPGPVPPGFKRAAGDHPIPRARSLRATRALYDWLDEFDGPLLALVSGGGSALLFDPPAPWRAAEVAALEGELLRSGAAIKEINAVRARLSRARAGGLAARLGASPLTTAVWCDTAPREWRLTASGPTLPPPRGPSGEAVLRRLGLTVLRPLPSARPFPDRPLDRACVLAHSGLLARDLASRLRREGWETRVLPIAEGTPPEAAAERMALWASGVLARPAAFVGAGECPVRVAGKGRGGRCTHLACAVALVLARERGWTFAAVATDGVDGSGGGGAVVADGARPSVRELSRALALCDTGGLLSESGHLLPRRATGNNLRDLWVLFLE